MKILIVCALAFVLALAEPPVNNRYLPPQQGFRGFSAQPSQTYGAPANFNGQRQTDAVFDRRPSSTYGAPSFNSRASRPSTKYGAPKSSNQPTSRYLPPSQYSTASLTPSTQYGARSRQNNYQTPSSQYGAPVESYQTPSSQYSQPSNNYGTPNQHSQPSNKYGAPSQFSQPSNSYGAPSFGRKSEPSQQYGTPGFDNQQYSQNSLAGNSGFAGTDRAYLPPGAGGYADDDGSNGEPANYSFEYMVKDEPSGNDFGHRESRQGDHAEGLYYVLLPDGRKQTVEYEADQNGYKPRISYEDTGLINGYRNGQGGYQDYQDQEGY